MNFRHYLYFVVFILNVFFAFRSWWLPIDLTLILILLWFVLFSYRSKNWIWCTWFRRQVEHFLDFMFIPWASNETFVFVYWPVSVKIALVISTFVILYLSAS
jgi:hypothetical protein